MLGSCSVVSVKITQHNTDTLLIKAIIIPMRMIIMMILTTLTTVSTRTTQTTTMMTMMMTTTMMMTMTMMMMRTTTMTTMVPMIISTERSFLELLLQGMTVVVWLTKKEMNELKISDITSACHENHEMLVVLFGCESVYKLANRIAKKYILSTRHQSEECPSVSTVL